MFKQEFLVCVRKTRQELQEPVRARKGQIRAEVELLFFLS